MVDINLLNGICLTDIGGDSLNYGIMELQQVAQRGTSANRAKAYHQLAQTYLKHGQNIDAEIMLDSLHHILDQYDVPLQILHLDYEPILDHYFKVGNQEMVEQYVERMLREQKSFKEAKLNYNLIQTIIDLQTGSKLQELKILQLRQTNQQLYILICIILICVICAILLYQRKKHVKQIRHADEQLASLVEKLNRANDEKEKISQEVKEFLTEKDNRQEFETLTPYVLKESGETKFRQCFELLYPLFLPRLREKVPSVSRREELLSMLIALKQDNKNIAELLAIAPRSVLMLRHRFRQKIGMNTEYSLENFIEELLTDE
jgi:DNA-binding CsgD family transcriptional regulator